MKSIRTTVVALICALPMAAQAELTLRLATPGDPINNPIEDIEITASAIDAVVGTNFFSTQANALVADLAALRQDLEGIIRDHVLLNPDIRSVQSVVVRTNPISARLTQKTSAIGLSVAGIDTTVNATADGIPLLCPSVSFTAEINSTGNGTFNFLTGLIANIDISNNVNVTGASCSGLFGFLGNILAAIFTDGLNNMVEGRIEDGLQDFVDFGSVQTMFRLTALTQDLVQAIPPGPIKDKVLVLVDQFLFLLSQNAGLQLDISLDPDFYGPTGPLLSLTASQREPSVSADLIQSETIITVNAPGAIRYDIYAQGFFLISTTSSPVTVGYQAPGHEILAVAHSALIPGLKSFPRQTLVEELFSGCGQMGPICFP